MTRPTTLRRQLPRGPFWTYFIAALFFNFGFALFFFLFNIYLLSLGFNEKNLGAIGSFSQAGRLLATIPIGLCAQRFGLRRTLVTAVTLSVLATFARLTLTSLHAQFACASIAGFAMCAWGVCLPPTVAALTRKRDRPFAFSLVFVSGIGDAGLGAFAAGHLPGFFAHHALTAQQPQRATLALGVSIAAIALIPLSRLQTHRPLALPKRPGNIFHNITPFMRRFLLATAVWAVVLGAFPPFANVFFVRHLHLTVAQMGSVLSVSQFVQFAAILAAPLLFRFTGFTRGILFTQLLTAIALFSLGGATTLLAASCSYFFYGAMQNASEPAIASLLMDRTHIHNRNTASSLTTLVTACVQIFASTAVGTGIVRFGYKPVLDTIAVLALLAAALFRTLPNISSLSQREIPS